MFRSASVIIPVASMALEEATWLLSHTQTESLVKPT